MIEIRLLPCRRQAWCESLFKVVSAWDSIQDANRGGENVYFGANPRSRRDGTSGSVTLARCVFADIDCEVSVPGVLRRVEKAGLPEPTAIVVSGHGVHLWWRLTEPVTDLSGWSVIQKRLALALNSDPKVHDPPRIMRLPGTMNVKGDPVACEVESSGGPRVSLEHLDSILPPWDQSKGDAASLYVAASGGRAPLAYATVEFLGLGAPEGERNHRLFRAAADMCGCGYSLAEASGKLVEAAVRSGLERDEAQATIASAYGKPRTPAKPPEIETPIGWNTYDGEIQSPKKVTEKPPAKDQDEDAPLRSFGSDWIKTPSARPSIINAQTIKGGPDEKSWLRHYTAAQIASGVREFTGGWPRVAGGRLFTCGHPAADGCLPSGGSVLWLDSVDALFAWFNEISDVHWTRREVRSAAKDPRSTPTKGEFLEYLIQHPSAFYDGVEYLPHHPHVEKLWYAPCRLHDDDGKALADLVARLNAETGTDRLLLLAALATPGWGGACGARPAMVLTSKHGRGVGKTTTAELIASVWGLCVALDPKEDWEKVKGRMLSDEAMRGRVVLMDNIKGRLSGTSLESMLTSPVINGWKPYVGNCVRPNRLAYVITSNTPRLSTDLSERSVVIHIGEPKWKEANFAQWAADHIERHRPEIVSALLTILAGGGEDIPHSSLDRWGRWGLGVLAKCCWAARGGLPALAGAWHGEECPSALEALSAVKERRAEVDDDAANAEDVAEAIRRAMDRVHCPESETTFLTNKALSLILEQAEIGTDLGRNAALSWVGGLAGTGELRPLAKRRHGNHGRGWKWATSADPVESEIYKNILDIQTGPAGKPELVRVSAPVDELPI